MSVTNGVQHENITLRSAMMCVDLTQAVRNVIATLVGQRSTREIAVARTWSTTLNEANYYKSKAARNEFLADIYRSIIDGIAESALDPARAEMYTLDSLRELIRAAQRTAADEEPWRPPEATFPIPGHTSDSPPGPSVRP
jgi:hypothetical protein